LNDGGEVVVELDVVSERIAMLSGANREVYK